MNLDRIATMHRNARLLGETLGIIAEGKMITRTADTLWKEWGLEIETDTALTHEGPDYFAVLVGNNLEILDTEEFNGDTIRVDLNSASAQL